MSMMVVEVLILGVHEDGSARDRLQFWRSADMVDMRVRDDNRLAIEDRDLRQNSLRSP